MSTTKRKKSSVTKSKTLAGLKFKVGNQVAVSCRFGETGTVKKIKDGRYGVKFQNLDLIIWYDEKELTPQEGEGFSWFRMPTS